MRLYRVIIMTGGLLCLAPQAWGQDGGADQISKAYVKELSFLKAQKKALQQRAKTYQERSSARVKQANAELKRLELELIQLQRTGLEIEAQLRDVEQQELALDQVEASYEVFSQAQRVLASLGLELSSLPERPSVEDVTEALARLTSVTVQALKQGTQLRRAPQAFFNQDGVEVRGEVLEVGRVARLGRLLPSPRSASESLSPLSPAGKGHFKVWSLSEGEDLYGAQGALEQAFNGESPSLLPLVLFERYDLAMEKKKSKTWRDELKAGGSVGYVIVLLGLIAFSFALWRSLSLMLLGRSFQDRRVLQLFEALNRGAREPSVTPELSQLAAALPSSRMVPRVLRSTLRGLAQGGRSLGEEYGFEQLLKEQSRLERFGALIMVSASIAPLLGLLGTVSGMIATFDIITEFGTGDPRLLSGGISEALITTRLGLIVAIPTLFLGTLLNGQSTRLASRAQIKMLELLNLWEEGELKAVVTDLERTHPEPHS